jgi:putative oxidoreductase
MNVKDLILNNDNSKATIIIRLIVGLIFLSEGIQKFLYPEIRGVGRFESIGLPYYEFLGYFVASFEVLCGFLILIGLFTRIAAIPTIVIMIVAIISTKIPIFFEQGFWYMLMGSIFLLIKGSGKWSLDNILIMYVKKSKN